MINAIGIGLFCSVSLYAFYLYQKKMEKAAIRVRQTQAKNRHDARATLVQDPVTGVYSVKR